jgi:hypothetical protein
MNELINKNIKLDKIDLYELLISYIELHFHIFYFLTENGLSFHLIQSCFSLIRIIYIYILSLTNNIDLSEFIAFKFSMFFSETYLLSQIYDIEITISDIKEILLISYLDFFTNHKNLNTYPNSEILNILKFLNNYLNILLFSFSEPIYNSKELSIFIVNIINFKDKTHLMFECLSKIIPLISFNKFKPIWIYKLFNLKFTSLSNFIKKNYPFEHCLNLLDKIWNETISFV